MKKTNAMRILGAQGIPFRVEEYLVDPDDLSAGAVAAKLGLDPSQVYKTLVTRGKAGVYFAVLPGDRELSPRKLARLAGERKVALVPLKDVQRLTGYIRGGVTVLGAKKAYPVFVHDRAVEHAEISVSAGARGLQILLDPRDYLRATGGELGDIVIAGS